MDKTMGEMKHSVYCIDTNIFILLFNNRLKEQIPDGDLVCSIITEIELLSFTALPPNEELLIRERLALLKIYKVDNTIKEKTIQLRRTSPLKIPDAIIAATAMIHDCVLVSNDKLFQNVPGLNCRELAYV
jgi:predicted nucleic acid-binding protein